MKNSLLKLLFEMVLDPQEDPIAEPSFRFTLLPSHQSLHTVFLWGSPTQVRT